MAKTTNPDPDNSTFADRKADREANPTPPKPPRHIGGFPAGLDAEQPDITIVRAGGTGDRVRRIDV